MDPARSPGRGPLEDLLLEVVQPVAEHLDYRIVAIEHGVYECVDEVVGAVSADHPLTLSDPLAHGVEDIAVLLLER